MLWLHYNCWALPAIAIRRASLAMFLAMHLRLCYNYSSSSRCNLSSWMHVVRPLPVRCKQLDLLCYLRSPHAAKAECGYWSPVRVPEVSDRGVQPEGRQIGRGMGQARIQAKCRSTGSCKTKVTKGGCRFKNISGPCSTRTTTCASRKSRHR